MGLCLMLSVLILAIPGCTTTPKVDWNSRVGEYTYDQAVLELGPPTKQAKLTNGETVAEWVTHQSSGGLSIGTGFFNGGTGVGVSQGMGSSIDHVLRLNFGEDNKLVSWSKN